MSDWISVEERLPTKTELSRYHVKTVEGSIERKTYERVLLGRLYPSGFRFMTGDWQYVTHWRDYE